MSTSNALPITAEMHEQIAYLSINSGILDPTNERMSNRPDRNNETPSEDLLIRRFWSAYYKLVQLVESAKIARTLDAKDREIAELRAQLASSKTTKTKKAA